ncbi:MAG: hypothetical protein ABSE80_14180, partial [Halobacteriota archaeon]
AIATQFVKGEAMKPEGLKSKLKDNSKKLHRNRAEWQLGKKLGRPTQQFNERTNTWAKVMPGSKMDN